MKKKLLALVLTLAMALSLAACGGGDAPAGSTNDVPPADTQEPADTGSDAGSDAGSSGEVYKVGICQLAPHPALKSEAKRS